ncbi:hypothetical protein ACKS0A_09750 [Histoplasma ohiense]
MTKTTDMMIPCVTRLMSMVLWDMPGVEPLEPSPRLASTVKSKVNVPWLSWKGIDASTSAELRGLPRFTAQIQGLFVSVGFMEPPSQLIQLSQSTFAIIFPLEIPEPSRRRTWAEGL